MLTMFSTIRVTRRASALLVGLSLLGIGTAVSAQEPAATPQPISSLAPRTQSPPPQMRWRLRFEVAEDGTHFVWDPDLVFDDDMPAYGASFITHGYIYPAGTLTESNGVKADGSPEFPDQVLGEWICRGWFAGEGLRTMTGAMVITSQLYNFGDELGTAMIASDGYELANVGQEIARAVTGGTGQFATANGEARQTLIGMNATQGVNLQYELALEDAGA